MSKYTQFLQEEQFRLLNKLEMDTQAQWGIMTAQHMVEHLGSLYVFTLGKTKLKAFFSPEKLLRNYQYLIQNKQPFHTNVRLPGLEKPLALRYANLDDSITALKSLVDAFYAFFKDDLSKKTLHPAAGLLQFSEWEYIHYAHSHHHLYQFNLSQDSSFTKHR